MGHTNDMFGMTSSMLWLIRSSFHGMINSPLANTLIVLAHPRRAIIRPWITIIERKPERKNIDVSLAHDKLSQSIDAVVEMTMEIVYWGCGITTLRCVVVFVIVLS